MTYDEGMTKKINALTFGLHSSFVIRHFTPVILSREDGEGSLTISAATQHRAEMIRDSSTPLPLCSE
jgi:hypothetical protein